MLKHSLTAAAVAALFISPALAQSGTTNADTMKPNTMKPAASSPVQTNPARIGNKPETTGSMSQTPSASKDSITAAGAEKGQMASGPMFFHQLGASNWRVSQLIGASVAGADGKSVGDINEVLINDDGDIHAVVIGVGGFLGVGEKDVAVNFDQLHIMPAKEGRKIEKVTVSLTKEQLNGAPSFSWKVAENTKVDNANKTLVQPTTTVQPKTPAQPMK